MNELLVASPTTRAAILGSVWAAMAMLTTRGTRRTVAPTLEMTRVKMVESIPMTVKRTMGWTSPIVCRMAWAIHAAVPVFSVAIPRGISPARRKMVRQSTDW